TTFDADWVLKNVGHVIRALEEPPLALPALAQYRVFELCREHGATVVLDGEGSDEILAGYPINQRTLLADRLRKGRFGDLPRALPRPGPRNPRRASLRVVRRAGLASRAAPPRVAGTRLRCSD